MIAPPSLLSELMAWLHFPFSPSPPLSPASQKPAARGEEEETREMEPETDMYGRWEH